MFISKDDAVDYIVFAIKLTSNNDFSLLLKQYEPLLGVSFTQDLSEICNLYNKVSDPDRRKEMLSNLRVINKGPSQPTTSSNTHIITHMREMLQGFSRDILQVCLNLLTTIQQFNDLGIKLRTQLCAYNFTKDTRHTEIVNALGILSPFVIKYDYYINFIPTFMGHQQNIIDIKELTGNRVITSSEDRTFKIWDLKTNMCISTIGNSEPITYFIVLSDDQIITYFEEPWNYYTLGMWTPVNGKYEHSVICDVRGIQCITLLPNDLFITGGLNGELIIWDPTRIHFKVQGHTVSVTLIIVVDNRIISGCSNGEIKVWNLEDMKLQHTLTGHTQDVQLIVPCSKNRIVSYGYKDSLIIFDWNTGGLLFKEKCDDMMTNLVIFIDDNREEWIISGEKEGTFKVRSVDTGHIKMSLLLPYQINTLAVLPNNQILVCLRDGHITIIDIDKESIIHPHDYGCDSYRILVSKSGKVILGCSNGMVHFIG